MVKNNYNFFERYPRVTIVCFLLASILIIDFLSASIYKFFKGYPWVYRVVMQADIKWNEQRRREITYRIPSKFYHHDLSAKIAGCKTSWGPYIYTVYTNSLGFKDKSTRNISLIPDKHRIVFMGDSFTEGVGIEYENTFVGLIDEALSKKGIEVLNAGVSSYSPIIYWRKTKYLIEDVGLKFDELFVFLDISDAEDEAIYYCLDESGNVVKYDARELAPGNIEHVSEEEPYYKTLAKRLKTGFTENSILVHTVYKSIKDRFFLKEKEPARNYTPSFNRNAWTINSELYQEYGAQGLLEMQIYMDKLHDLLKKNNIKLTVAVYPHPTQIMYNDLNSIQVTFWEDWCSKHKVNVINYFPYFVTGKTEDDRKQVVDKYFFKNNAHWNKEGHRLGADVLLTDLTDQEIFDATEDTKKNKRY